MQGEQMDARYSLWRGEQSKDKLEAWGYTKKAERWWVFFFLMKLIICSQLRNKVNTEKRITKGNGTEVNFQETEYPQVEW